jgi:hypothetical protein
LVGGPDALQTLDVLDRILRDVAAAHVNSL